MKRYYVLLLALLMTCLSCSTKFMIRKNDKVTDVRINTLVNEYGNVFYIRSSNSTFSAIWYYTEEKLILYRVSNGKIVKENNYQTLTYNSFPDNEKKYFELDECLELDGDILGFSIRNQQGLQEESFPINLTCFSNRNFESEFLESLKKDIDNFNIWDIKE